MAGRGKTPAFLQLQELNWISQNANRGTAAAEMASFTLFYEWRTSYIQAFGARTSQLYLWARGAKAVERKYPSLWPCRVGCLARPVPDSYALKELTNNANTAKEWSGWKHKCRTGTGSLPTDNIPSVLSPVVAESVIVEASISQSMFHKITPERQKGFVQMKYIWHGSLIWRLTSMIAYFRLRKSSERKPA